MSWKKVAWLFGFLLLIPFLNVSKIQAAELEGQVGYSVRALIPDNQRDKNKTYFDLRMEAGQKQTIEVEIFNTTPEDATIQVAITNAASNRNGMIEYTDTESDPDESLRYPLTEIAHFEESTVIVPAGSSILVPIHLEMPAEEFDGILLGGIYFRKEAEGVAAQGVGMGLTNEYAYVLGLQLSENDKVVVPDLNLTSVTPELVNGRPAVIAEIQNRAPVIASQLRITSTIQDEAGREKLAKEVNDYRMAPQSTMAYTLDWQDQKIDPGTYTLNLTAVSGEREWEWTEEFTIAPDAAEAINEEAIVMPAEHSFPTLIFFLLLVLLLVIVILLLYINRLKKRTATAS